MNKLIIISLFALSTASIANAQINFLEAGWDFSQYGLDIDSLSTNTLGANYSDNLASGAGPDAAQFGTLYYDGSFGSSFSNGIFDSKVIPTTTNLSGNTNVGEVPFNSLTTLMNEGQTNANPFGLSIAENSQVFSIVFKLEEAFLTLGPPGISYGFSFAGVSTGEDIPVTLEIGEMSNFDFSQVFYTPLTSFTLTSNEQVFSVDDLYIGGNMEPVFIRMNFDLDTANAAVIDNVAFYSSVVPEPKTYAAILGVSALIFVAVKRKK